MKKATRALYTLEFKEEAVRLASGGERISTVARSLGWPSRRNVSTIMRQPEW